MHDKALVDIDGVLSDFTRAICEAHHRDNPYELPEWKGKYNAFGEAWGLPPEVLWEPCSHEKFWEDMQPTADCFKIMEIIEANFDAENVCLLSRPFVNPYLPRAASGKMLWIAKHLPKYKSRFLIGPNKNFCAHFNASLFDDCPNNVKEFTEHGGSGILIPRPWNVRGVDHHFAWAVQNVPRYLQYSLN